MKSFDSTHSYKKIIQVFVFLLLPLGLAFNVNLIAPLLDSFHEGEYLDNLLTLRSYYAGASGFPLLIHGAMDYLPTLLAAKIAGADHLLVWTRFFNVLAVTACWILYMDMARIVLREQSRRHVWTVIFLLLFIWMAAASGEDPIRKQQAFLGTRDVFLVLSLWVGVKAIHTGKASAAYLGLVAAGVFGSASLYWSYDRGILSIIWILALAAAFFYQKRLGYALAVLSSYAATLFAIAHTGLAGSLQENLDNIIYWTKNTGDVWFVQFHLKRYALPNALAMAMLALATIFHVVSRTLRQPLQKTLPLVLGLIMIQLVFLTKLYSLPSFPTNYYFIWPSFLLLVLVPPASRALDSINQSLDQLYANLEKFQGSWKREDKVAFWGVVLMAVLFCSNSAVSSVFTAAQLARPLADDKLIDRFHYGINAVPANSAHCVFQWSNEGVFALLLKKPYCTQYGYAVYIAKNREAAVLDEFKRNPPGLIVYDSPYWSMSIYKRSMQERLPAIDRFIHENYVFQDSGTGYVFATPKLQKGLK